MGLNVGSAGLLGAAVVVCLQVAISWLHGHPSSGPEALVRSLLPVASTLFEGMGAGWTAASSPPQQPTGGHATFVIVGAGAAGLQWGVLCENAGIDYVILERAAQAGSFFSKLPRRRSLISINKPNVGAKSKDFVSPHLHP